MAKILVVEDSSIDRMLIGGLLGKETSWDVTFANDGVEAIQLITDQDSNGSNSQPKFRPDVIITDLQMPNMDGLELVRRVRISHPDVPVVLVTSQGSEQIALESLRAGATSFTPKTMLRADLNRTVNQVLEMSKHMRYTHDTKALPAPKQVAFVLENESSLIGPTIEHLQENLPSWSDRDRLQIGMAMDEALVNAMHHGNLEVDSKQISDIFLLSILLYSIFVIDANSETTPSFTSGDNSFNIAFNLLAIGLVIASSLKFSS